jgi:lysozyme family protein
VDHKINQRITGHLRNAMDVQRTLYLQSNIYAFLYRYQLYNFGYRYFLRLITVPFVWVFSFFWAHSSSAFGMQIQWIRIRNSSIRTL